jgi:hypothetical protein
MSPTRDKVSKKESAPTEGNNKKVTFDTSNEEEEEEDDGHSVTTSVESKHSNYNDDTKSPSQPLGITRISAMLTLLLVAVLICAITYIGINAQLKKGFDKGVRFIFTRALISLRYVYCSV